MKKQILICSLVIGLIITAKAQVSTPFNTGVAANFVGWNSNQPFPLSLRHDGAQPINFFTNNTQRMTILGTNGFVGIGNNFNAPISLFHQHMPTAAAVNFHQWTNSVTGQTEIDGTRLGIVNNGTAHLYNQENRHLLFSTNAATPALNTSPTNERVRITAIGTPGTTNPDSLPDNTTRTSISYNPINPVNQPLTLLHMGDNAVGGTGFRPW